MININNYVKEEQWNVHGVVNNLKLNCQFNIK